MEQIRNFLVFLAMFFAIVGLIGGIGYCLYSDEIVIALCVLLLGGMAYPTLKGIFKRFFIND